MKLCTFEENGASRIGRIDGESVLDLARAVPGLPTDMAALLGEGPAALDRVRSADDAGAKLPLSQVALTAPVPKPPKILAIGLNYADHIKEMGREQSGYPIWFNKQRTCVIGPGAPIEKPNDSDAVDYEGELVAVVGRGGRYIPEEDALSALAGFTIGNDVSVRDWQKASPTFIMGKSFDSHGPTGPWIVTTDEIADPQAMPIRTYVNGDLRQDASTGLMIRPVAEQIAFLSRHFTLEPGDLIFTGTPAGVGAGFDPAKFLQIGDTVRIEIDGIGVLENPVGKERGAPA